MLIEHVCLPFRAPLDEITFCFGLTEARAVGIRDSGKPLSLGAFSAPVQIDKVSHD
jgi:hypothetical protein